LKASKEMAYEKRILEIKSFVQLTQQCLKLIEECESLLLKKTVMEVVAGLVEVYITGIVVILSAIITISRHHCQFILFQHLINCYSSNL
jgi:hypothetical protein